MANVKILEPINNLSLGLSYPEEMKIVMGHRMVNFTNLDSGTTIKVKWSLVPFYEGNYTLLITVYSERGEVQATREIRVRIPQIFPKLVQLYNLTVACIDINNRPLRGIAVRVRNARTGLLVAYNITDINGEVIFHNLPVGIYEVEITDGVIKNSTTIFLYRSTSISLTLGRATLELIVCSADGSPLSDAVVYIYDVNGTLIFLGYTDENGILRKSGLALTNYTISIRWMDSTLDYFSLILRRDITLNVTLSVYRLLVYVILSDGRPLIGARILISLETEEFRPRAIAYTNEKGVAELILPRGTYVVSVEKGQYSGKAIVKLDRNKVITIVCATINTLWILTSITAGLWAFTVFYWQRVTKITYRERQRYRQLLKRLEELYKKGLVEEKYYIQLKSEYEEKLRKLRGEEA